MPLCSHYFAVFVVGVEAAWLLVALRARWRAALPAVAGVGLVGLVLLPLISAQVNPNHIGWIDARRSRALLPNRRQLPGRRNRPRDRRAATRTLRADPGAAAGVALLLLALRGSRPGAAGGVAPLAIGLGMRAGRPRRGFAGKDYVVERNLLPALVPLAIVVAIGFSGSRTRRLGLACATLSALWLGLRCPRRPHAEPAAPRFSRARRTARASREGRERSSAGNSPPTRSASISVTAPSALQRETPLRESMCGKPVAEDFGAMPPSFRPVERIRLERLTLIRFESRRVRRSPLLPASQPADRIRQQRRGFRPFRRGGGQL